MKHPYRILWLFALVGVSLGVVIGLARRDDKSEADPAAKTAASADAYTLAELAQRANPAPVPPSPTDSTNLLEGIDPKEEITCTLDGVAADITTWPNSATQAMAKTVTEGCLGAFGVSLTYASGEGWWASGDSDSGASDAGLNRTAELFAERLGGEVVHFEPS